jgi:lysyl-tRNA synthetase class I
MQITLEQLKQLCEDYDKAEGLFPESEKEGQSVYDFIEEELNKADKQPNYSEIALLAQAIGALSSDIPGQENIPEAKRFIMEAMASFRRRVEVRF